MSAIFYFLLTIAFVSSDKTFWITTELQSVDWEDRCQNFCSKPAFQVEELLLPHMDTITHRWKAEPHTSIHRTVSRWQYGNSDDLAMSFSVFGIDPLTSAPRRCGETEAIRVFPTKQVAMIRPRRHEGSIAHQLSDSNKRLVELRGNCFNATLLVEKHLEKCPDCPDTDKLRQLEEQSSVFTGFLAKMEERERLLLIAIAACGLLAILSFVSLVILLLRNRNSKTSSQSSSGPSPYYYPQYIPEDLPKITSPARYDVPWRSSPFLTISNASTTRRADTVVTEYEEISPNTSIGTNDSGLIV
ncbi:unnamed protein product [Auanema sp. JU1783]|nr:unnamed protein product [Auanema sp. JU1783]